MATPLDPKTFLIIRNTLQDAVGFQSRGELDQAERLYRQILDLDPCQFDALHLLGTVAFTRKNPEAAVALIQQAISIDATRPAAYFNMGQALAALKRSEDAAQAFTKAIGLGLERQEAYAARARELYHLRRFEDAIDDFERAVALGGNTSELHNDRAAAFAAIRKLDQAISAYDQAIAFDPNSASTYVNRGHALLDQCKFEQAIASYTDALALAPGFPFLRGAQLHARLHACLWDGLEQDIVDLKIRIERGESVVSPWLALILFDEPDLHRKAAEIWTRFYYATTAISQVCHPRNKKIRVGYYSADFHAHATSHLMAELFELHDRARFEFFAFSFGPDRQDAVRARIVKAFDHFIDVRHRSDSEIVELSRELHIDIAVDLKGYTQDNRMGMFAQRLAPVQASYIGYPGTLGCGYMDYIIADEIVLPSECRQFYTEKVVALPHSYQVNDGCRAVSERHFSRRDLGLPKDSFVFCCFNHSAKLLPEMFSAWMRILQSVPKSVIWLLVDNEKAANNLRQAAQKRGVQPDRLVFAHRVPSDEHLARLKCADLFLDTLPYNAHTTASDALWVGLPVVTQTGKAFAGRVASSLLNAINLSELVVADIDAYEALAVDLAQDHERLRNIKEKLAMHRRVSPLFDTQRFARNLEVAYQRMWERYEQGAPPDHIVL